MRSASRTTLYRSTSLPAAQQLVDLRLARAVEGHQALERRGLVVGVVVDVHRRVALDARGEEVHELLEGALLAGAVVRPERLEARAAVLEIAHAEEVFEPARLERVALHVEEHVARVGLRQALEAAARSIGNEGSGRQEFELRLAGLAALELQARLALQPGE